MIKAVLFDVYGTVAGWQPSRYEIQSRACVEFGIAVTPKGILKGYAAADAFMTAENSTNPIRLRDDKGKAQFFGEYQQLVLEGCDIYVSSKRALEIFSRVRQMPYKLAPFNDVVPALDQLRERGIAVGLISNLADTGEQISDNLGLTNHLDFAVTSGDVGAEKPDPVIFRAALDQASVEPHEAMMVGDQPSSDIEGALAIGIAPVLIDRDGNHPSYDRCPCISDLAEFPQIVDRSNG